MIRLSCMSRVACVVCFCSFILLLFTGCRQPPPVMEEIPEDPQYSRALPEGAFGLVKVTNDPQYMPDIQSIVGQFNERSFLEAAQRSLSWFRIPSTQQFYPVGPISHDQAYASVFALTRMKELPPEERLRLFEEDFDVWMSVGWDQRGTVFYTGYYSPIFQASRTRTERFRYPLYQRPENLISNPITGHVQGVRTASGAIIQPPTRAEYEQQPQQHGLAGRELVYLPSRLDAYIIEVNGSARLNFQDGTTMDIGFAGTNGYDYTSIRQLMVEDGKLKEHEANLITMRNYFDRHPGELDRYIQRNDRIVFFKPYEGGNWPAGSLGVQVTPMRTLATDKAIFPRGSVVLVDTKIGSTVAGEVMQLPFTQLMLDQDTGGAIRAPGRGDIYIGIGPRAEQVAGTTAAEGRLYYFLLKPEKVSGWMQQLKQR